MVLQELDWKQAVEREITSKAACLKNLLRWVSDMDKSVISEAMVLEAVGGKLTEDQTLGMMATL